MAFLKKQTNRPDFPRNEPPKKGLAKVFSIIWREFWPLIKLNIIFIIFCVPIITIPAAITAMSWICYRMGRNENVFLWHDFWRQFKNEFVKSLLGGIILSAMIMAFSISTYVYVNLYGRSKLFIILAGCSISLIIIVLCAGFYFFPMLAMVELTLKQLLVNSVLMCLPYIKRTLLALLSFVLFLGIGIAFLPYSVVYIGMVMFSFMSLSIVLSVYPAIESRIFASRPSMDDQSKGGGISENKEGQPIQSAEITDWED